MSNMICFYGPSNMMMMEESRSTRWWRRRKAGRDHAGHGVGIFYFIFNYKCYGITRVGQMGHVGWAGLRHDTVGLA